MKEPHSTRWTPVAQTMDTAYTVTGLKDGTEYEFRVAAENKAGLGKYSEVTEAVMAKEPYGKILCSVCLTLCSVIRAWLSKSVF